MINMITKWLFIAVFFLNSCSAQNSVNLKLIGSTPGDDEIKTMLLIPADTQIDFIKWDLLLEDSDSFELGIQFGLSKPNTLDFINDGQMLTFKGHFFKTSISDKYSDAIMLQTAQGLKISLVKISDNVYHILNKNNRLMNGNGGWSYSLFSKERIESNNILIKSSAIDLSSKELVFDGRTPCQEFAKEQNRMEVSKECFKLKWRFVFQKEKGGATSGKCIIKNIVGQEPKNMDAQWELIKDENANFLYKIVHQNFAKPILFFIADENVLFFVDDTFSPLIGNENFGFALNRKK